MKKTNYSTEIRKLSALLDSINYPYELRTAWDGWQIRAKNWDVICHSGSYGHEEGLLEAMGIIVDDSSDDDDVVGYLTASDVFQRVCTKQISK